MATYFGASFCIPGFFLMSGYLLNSKEEVGVSYIEGKVVDTMAKLFGWVVFWVAVHYLKTGELHDLWGNFMVGASSGGILPVAWFLFTYCLLMIMGYPLYHFCKKYPVFFSIMIVIWMMAMAMGAGKNITEKTQSLWIHLYLGYFCLGMVLKKLKNIKVFKLKHQMIIAVFINVFCASVYAFNVKNAETWIMPALYYGKWFYTLWLISLFWLVINISVKGRMMQKMISGLAENTFVVYLGHLPILLYVTERHPIQNFSMAVAFVITFFLGLEIWAEVMKKLPLLRRLV